MSSRKAILAALTLAAIVGVVPQVHAQTVKVVIAGSSALWQSMALGAFNNGTSIVSGGGPTSHWTSASNAINLTDTRPSPVNSDAGTMWVVWDSASPTNVWAFVKVDSVVGDRCYFAQPHCNANGPGATLSAAGADQISTALWGPDSGLPTNIQAIFTSGSFVTVAATDIRPEDAAFAECRVNSALGASTVGGSASDGLDGLGYNSHNAAGVCPVFPIGTTGKGVGNPILSGYPGSAAAANVLAFNITGKDPFSDTPIPAYVTTTVGASPIVFIIERDKGQLAELTNASEIQLQEAFSGTNCSASAFGLPAGAISINLREPLSGTMNTTEATVFRRPTVYPNKVLGLSQERNVNAPVNNPLKAQARTCLAGTGGRYRAIGTGEEVKSVQNSGANYGHDGIGYTFFSYGNVSSIANSSNYGYITLNGIDPIFQTYGSTLDPGQPAGGDLPAAANLPATCAGGAGAFPCSEHDIWKNGFSFPNLRNGTYRSWSLLRLVSNGTGSTNAAALVKASNIFVVNDVPDYVPAGLVAGTTDLGIKLLRSHYQQKDGAGTLLGSAPVNTPEKGGDMGGYIIPTLIGVTTFQQTQLIQNANSVNSNLGPVERH
jgi:hypothetical protein